MLTSYSMQIEWKIRSFLGFIAIRSYDAMNLLVSLNCCRKRGSDISIVTRESWQRGWDMLDVRCYVSRDEVSTGWKVQVLVNQVLTSLPVRMISQ